MHLSSGVWFRALLFAVAIGLALLGAGFLTYGLYLSLIPSAGYAGAALLTAAFCLIAGGVLVAALVMKSPAPAPTIQPALTPVEPTVVESNAMIKALSELAQDHPIMAVAAAAILGATGAGTTGTPRR